MEEEQKQEGKKIDLDNLFEELDSDMNLEFVDLLDKDLKKLEEDIDNLASIVEWKH